VPRLAFSGYSTFNAGEPGAILPAMAEVTNEFLARMIASRFNVMAAEFSAVNHRLDMLTTSVHEIASLRASHEEISVVHDQLNRLRQTVTELRAQVEELKPTNLNGADP
jgi:hypothetical protein